MKLLPRQISNCISKFFKKKDGDGKIKTASTSDKLTEKKKLKNSENLQRRSAEKMDLPEQRKGSLFIKQQQKRIEITKKKNALVKQKREILAEVGKEYVNFKQQRAKNALNEQSVALNTLLAQSRSGTITQDCINNLCTAFAKVSPGYIGKCISHYITKYKPNSRDIDYEESNRVVMDLARALNKVRKPQILNSSFFKILDPITNGVLQTAETIKKERAEAIASSSSSNRSLEKEKEEDADAEFEKIMAEAEEEEGIAASSSFNRGLEKEFYLDNEVQKNIDNAINRFVNKQGLSDADAEAELERVMAEEDITNTAEIGTNGPGNGERLGVIEAFMNKPPSYASVAELTQEYNRNRAGVDNEIGDLLINSISNNDATKLRELKTKLETARLYAGVTNPVLKDLVARIEDGLNILFQSRR